jgi:hypothetical protein
MSSNVSVNIAAQIFSIVSPIVLAVILDRLVQYQPVKIVNDLATDVDFMLLN